MSSNMTEKIKEFLKKDNKILIKLIFAIIFSFGISLLLEKFVFLKVLYKYYSIDRIFIVTCLFVFIFMHFIFKISKMYGFIYKRRFILAGVLLFFIVIRHYTGSSLSIYNDVIQYQVDSPEYNEVLGVNRAIRSDEWAINTPLSFSQNVGEEKLPYYSNIVRAAKTDMFTIVNAPVLDIVSIGKLFNIGYIFGNDVGISFWWYGRLIALMLISFEFFMLLTNKNKKLSLVFMLIITFSPAVQWWYSNFITDILIWGMLALILIDKFLREKLFRKRCIYMALIAICAISYVFIFYPAWMISFAYVYLAVFIWLLLKNHKEYSFGKKDIILVICAILFIAFIGGRYYLMSKDALNATLNTAYPGDRVSEGGGRTYILMSYIYGIFFPVASMANPCELSSMFSLFPIPMILAVIFIVFNKDRKKHLKFIIPILLAALLLTCWCVFGLPEILAKITLLDKVPGNRAVVPCGLANILLLGYILTYKNDISIKLERKLGIILLGVISLITTFLMINYDIRKVPQYLTGVAVNVITYIIFACIIFFLLLVLFKKDVDKNTNKLQKSSFYKKLVGNYYNYLLLILGMFALLCGITVNPINRGTKVIEDKPLAKEVRKIVNTDKDAIWVANNYNYIHANYLVANGAKVINSTNYYPNFDLFYKIFDESEVTDEMLNIFNRYAHIEFNLIDGKSNIEMIYVDAIRLNVNYEKVKDLQIKYLISNDDLEKFNTDDITFTKIYDEYDFKIYLVEY